MIVVPRYREFRVTAGYFLLCVSLLLAGCGGSANRPGSQNVPPSDGTLQYSATLSYEDRQMMRRYLVQSLHDGIVAMVMMQARIDRRHGHGYLQPDGKGG